MEIIFIRHGESTQNVAIKNNQEYDRENIKLTELGQHQAIQTGKFLKKHFGKIDAIIHSSIFRCQETAELIAKQLKFTKKLQPTALLFEPYEKARLFERLKTQEEISKWFKLNREKPYEK